MANTKKKNKKVTKEKKENNKKEEEIKVKKLLGIKILLAVLIIIVILLSAYSVSKNLDLNRGKMVLKRDYNKDIVYTLYTSKSTNNHETKIPRLNINSIYADRINEEINTLMLRDYEIDDKEIKCKEYCSQITYIYYLNNNILSLLVKDDSAESPNAHVYHTYNIDIYTGEEITNKELVKLKKIKEEDFSLKLSNIIKKAYPFDKYYDGKNNYPEEKAYAMQVYNRIVDLKNCSIDNKMFLNDKGQLLVIVGIHYYAGGEGATYNLINMDTKQYIYYMNYEM